MTGWAGREGRDTMVEPMAHARPIALVLQPPRIVRVRTTREGHEGEGGKDADRPGDTGEVLDPIGAVPVHDIKHRAAAAVDPERRQAEARRADDIERVTGYEPDLLAPGPDAIDAELVGGR